MAKKIDQQRFDELYKRYYHCFGVSYQAAQTNFNNSYKRDKAEEYYKKLTRTGRAAYFKRVAEVAEKYLIDINGNMKFNLPQLLKDNGYSNDLSNLNLSSLDFSGCYFGGTNFENTTMDNCRFICVSKSNSNYDNHLIADFSNAIFSNTSMRGATIKFCKNTTDANSTFNIPNDAFINIKLNDDQSTKEVKEEYRTQKRTSNSQDITKMFNS